jgi:drug/metabolite transporter (DMT)-like permease
MTWQLSITFFFIISSTQTLWSRVYAQKSKLPGRIPPALQYSLALLPFGLVYLLINGNFHVRWSLSTVLYLLLEGLFIGAFNWLAFMAYKRTSVTQFQTIFQLYAVVAAVLGWVALGESLTFLQLLGSSLLFAGALIAAHAHREKTSKFTLSRGVLLTAGAASALGIGLVAEKAALGRMTLSAYFIFGYGMQAVASLVIASKELLHTKKALFTRHELLSCLGIGSLSAVGGFFYILSLSKTDNIALTTVVSTFQLPLTVLGGYFILRERDNAARMALACVIAFAGLVLCAS